MKHVQSRDNAQFKQLRKLATSSRARREAAETLIDGMHLFRSALDAGVRPKLAIVAERALDQSEVKDILAEQGDAVLLLADALFDELSPTDTPTGLLGLIDIPAEVEEPITGDCLVLDAVQDSGNLGTLLRAAWADARARMTDVGRLGHLLDTAAGTMLHIDLPRVSPMAVHGRKRPALKMPWSGILIFCR